jgi:penicillin-binding protein 1A
MDKTDEEIIASFSEKLNDCFLLGKEKILLWLLSILLLLQVLFCNQLMAMEPQTGNIKAWVGGINYKYFPIRPRRTRSETSRINIQTICVYATIEQLNMSPCDSIIDAPFTMPRTSCHRSVGLQVTRYNQYRGMVPWKSISKFYQYHLSKA